MIILKKTVLSAADSNCYILVDKESGEGAVIDAGDHTPALESAISSSVMKELKYILCTHCHFDHVSGAGRLKEQHPSALIVIGKKDAVSLSDRVESLSGYFGMPFFPCDADITLGDGDTLFLGETKIDVIETPGHSPGGVCYIINGEKTVFSGDTLFCGTVGRTDLFGGDFNLLKDSFRRLMTLPDDYRVFPGHACETTVGSERKNNPMNIMISRDRT